MRFYVDAGEFKHRIQIQEFKEDVNNDDIPTKTWTTIVNIKAKVINTSGREYMQGQGTGREHYKKMYIRYPKIDITNKHRIVYNNELYDITYVNNVDDANKYLEIVVGLKE